MAGRGLFYRLEEATCGLENLSEVRGAHDATGMVVGLAVARYHAELTGLLAREIIQELEKAGASRDQVDVVWVPGSFELPLGLKTLSQKNRYHSLIGIGAVLQGATSHADVIVNSVAGAMIDLSLQVGIPVLNAVVEAADYETALARCKPGPECRAGYLARAAIEMATVVHAVMGESNHG